MRIGVDIDGVVSDSYTYWLQELNRHFSKEVKILTDYDLHKVFEVPNVDMNEFFVGNTDRLLSMPEVVLGAKEGIEALLSEGHEIIYITARTSKEEDVTRRWFAKRQIPCQHVLFSGFASKVDLIKEWDIEVFVEDYHVNAQQISESGVPVFLLTTSYNECLAELPAKVKRCRNWTDILAGIHQLKVLK